MPKNSVWGIAMSSPEQKQYAPHVVIVWIATPGRQVTVAVQEYPYKEDAEEKYNEIVQLYAQKVVLAKVVRSHGEG
jgi:hypothetical protein